MMKNTQNLTLINEIRLLISESRLKTAAAINSAMTLLYWEIGKRINQEIDGKMRSELYGNEIVIGLCRELTYEFGKAFTEKNVRRMMQFAQIFQEKKIVVSLIRQLSWTHLLAIIPIDDPLKREFYIQMCIIEHWSVRTFRERINSMLYERTMISKKPTETIMNELKLLNEKKIISEDLVFRDPYLLDFLGLKDTYSEKDIQSAILVELQKFIIELGNDFAFMGKEKRITIDQEDFYIDLLFYHRKLRCLVVIELKLGKFEAAHKGQMELYLRWLGKYEVMEGENPPIGLILCATKNEEHVELLELEKSNIKVAGYLTKLPELKLLEGKLHEAIEIAKMKISATNR